MALPAVRWKGAPPVGDAGGVAAFARASGLSEVTSRILWGRGVRSPEAARSFLQPRLDGLLDPNGILGMSRAVGRIHAAVRAGEPIWIYGDYDVDGSTATALLVNFFRAAGIPIRAYIPHRVNEGYGLNVEALQTIAAEGGKVVVTVDNGISAFKEAEAAKALGIDLIVTDHHEPHETLPDAFAIVNPKQPGCAYTEKGLAGVGLAFKLAWGVAQGLSGEKKVSPPLREFLLDALGFVALGTIADMAPLLGENRILTSFGLLAIEKSKHPGLRALRDVCRFRSDRMTARDVSFGIAPRINAGGRIGKPDLGLKLLTTTSEAEAVEIAGLLDKQNRERQKIERAIVDEAMDRIGREGTDRRAIVVADEKWHVGVVGIVAARIVDRFHRPAVVIGWSPDGTGKGSGRSIDGFHLVDALKACADDLVTYGGHAKAAGVSLKRDRFDAFSGRLDAVAREWLKPEDFVPSVTVELSADFSALTPAVVDEVNRMAPFGIGNPRPVLSSSNVTAVGTRKKLWGDRYQVFLRQEKRVWPAIGPAAIVDALENNVPVEVAYTPKEAFRDPDGVELELKAARLLSL